MPGSEVVTKAHVPDTDSELLSSTCNGVVNSTQVPGSEVVNSAQIPGSEVVNRTQVPGSEVVNSIAPLSDCSSGRSSSGFFSSL